MGVFGLFILAFMGIEWISLSPATRFLSRLQAIPALLGLLSGRLPAFFFILVLLALTLLFGRIYCAVICPLGILQDGVIFLSRKSRRFRKGYRKSTPGLRYGILALTIVSISAGTTLLADAIDPFGVFGRISVHLLRPIAIMINNTLVFTASQFDIYSFSPVTARQIPVAVFWVTYAWFILVMFFSFFHGRQYCNTICPVGSLMGILSKFSWFNFVLDPDRCTQCGACGRQCRAGCIDVRHHQVDHSRCVSCFDCADVCPESAVAFTRAHKRETAGDPDPHRRRFIRTTLATGAGALVLGAPARSILNGSPASNPPAAATAPGSLGIDRFTNTCSACHHCISVCHTHVLQPTVFEFGVAGMFQPKMDFSSGRCDYTCNKCGGVCPTGAIQPLPLARKQRTQIGIVDFLKDKCIVNLYKRDCGACIEVCPTHAVYGIAEKNIRYPTLKKEVCIGCGACENVCPVMPKAIIVKPNIVHDVADPPYFQDGGEKIQVDRTDDPFPF